MATRTTVHRDGRVTGQVEVQDGRGRPLVIEYETKPHAEPMSADAMSAWDRLLWGANPADRIAEARQLAALRKAAPRSPPPSVGCYSPAAIRATPHRRRTTTAA